MYPDRRRQDWYQWHAVRPAPDGSNLSFKCKTIGDRRYRYLSVSLGSRRVESYLGAESPELLDTIDRERSLWGINCR